MGIFLDNYILQRDIFNVLSPEAGGPSGHQPALGPRYFATHATP
jgi:hypothetical protein